MKDSNDKFFIAIFVMWIIGALMSISLTGFAVWVIIKTMQHFGII